MARVSSRPGDVETSFLLLTYFYQSTQSLEKEIFTYFYIERIPTNIRGKTLLVAFYNLQNACKNNYRGKVMRLICGHFV